MRVFSLLIVVSLGLLALGRATTTMAGFHADPINDLLFNDPESTPDPDIIAIAGRIRGADLRVSVEFKPGTFLQPPGERTTGVGIYIDTDSNPATGGSGISLMGEVDSTIGWEFLIPIEGPSSALFEFIGPMNDDVQFRSVVLSTFTADGFTTIVPLASLGPMPFVPDDGNLTLKVVSFQYLGEPGAPVTPIFDVAPDLGLPAVGVYHGDFDDDSRVAAGDYHTWQTTFGITVPFPGSGADGNGDGIVNAADYVVWRNNLGTAPPGTELMSTASVAVPEPAAAVLAWIVSLAVVVGGKRIALHRAGPGRSRKSPRG